VFHFVHRISLGAFGLIVKHLFLKVISDLAQCRCACDGSSRTANAAIRHGISHSALLLMLLMAPLPALAGALDKALSSELQGQKSERAAQSQVDALDDEAHKLLDEYRQVVEELDQLKAHNEGLQRSLQAQQTTLEQMESELASAEATRREITPLMDRMQAVLGEFVARDLPFLHDERQARLSRLQALQAAPDSELAARYRALLEAYQVEAGYGQGVEAYRGGLDDGSGRLVDFLRLGRVALYYRSLDGAEAGAMDAASGQWRRLSGAQADDIAHALRVARQELPPELLLLPLPAPGEAP
jgi:hypothetical protein